MLESKKQDTKAGKEHDEAHNEQSTEMSSVEVKKSLKKGVKRGAVTEHDEGKKRGRKMKAGRKVKGLKSRAGGAKGVLHGITRNDIRRISARAGIARVSGKVVNEARQALNFYLTRVLREVAASVVESEKRTVKVEDVKSAIQHSQKSGNSKV